MKRLFVLLYGLLVYAFFFGVFLYTIGFLANWGVPKGIDAGEPAPLAETLLVNVGLLSLFAIQHTIMARPAFKRWWTQYVPVAAERSTFVLATSLILATLFWQWRPLPTLIWDVQTPALAYLLVGVSLAGWALVLYSSFVINHFELFGVRQSVLHFLGREYTHLKFSRRFPYNVVRHPLMVGFLIAFWATPQMSVGHLLFALVTTAYIVIGITIEERDLVRHVGPDYQEYQHTVPALVPLRIVRRAAP